MIVSTMNSSIPSNKPDCLACWRACARSFPIKPPWTSVAARANVTLKLLQLGLTVDALDLSPEMVGLLEQKAASAIQEGRLLTHIGTLDHLQTQGNYALITAYSVLHHVPDYLEFVEQCIGYLAPKGILLIDHEVVPRAGRGRALELAEQWLAYADAIIRCPYLFWRKFLKLCVPSAYQRLLPNMDYTVSDYWLHDGRSIEATAIQSLAESKGCSFERQTYLHFNGRWTGRILYPLFRSSAVDTQRFLIRKD
jgi:SAM-dependent methyltransferase